MNLLPTEIHLWPIYLHSEIKQASRFADLLSLDEAARAARFHRVGDRNSFIASRGLLRILLGRYLKLKPDKIEFCYGEAGKPQLKSTSLIHFNVSHSSNMALFAFNQNSELGVDVEDIRPQDDVYGIAKQFFCVEECQELMSLATDLRQRAFFHCWTRKEAYIKAIGEGLATPLDQFRVTLRPQDPARLVHVNQDIEQAAEWTLHDLDIDPGYAAALAYKAKPKTLHIIAYSEDGLTD